jgi:hypothetical protein
LESRQFQSVLCPKNVKWFPISEADASKCRVEHPIDRIDWVGLQRGHDFILIESSIHEALVKEAMATSVEATMQHFDRVEMSFRRKWEIVEH